MSKKDVRIKAYPYPLSRIYPSRYRANREQRLARAYTLGALSLVLRRWISHDWGFLARKQDRYRPFLSIRLGQREIAFFWKGVDYVA